MFSFLAEPCSIFLIFLFHKLSPFNVLLTCFGENCLWSELIGASPSRQAKWKAVQPSLLCSCSWVRASCRRTDTVSSSSFVQASISAVQSALFRALGFAPAVRRQLTTSGWLCWAASIRAVLLSKLRWSTGTPQRKASCTTARWPQRAASIKAVSPLRAWNAEVHSEAPTEAAMASTWARWPFWAASKSAEGSKTCGQDLRKKFQTSSTWPLLHSQDRRL